MAARKEQDITKKNYRTEHSWRWSQQLRMMMKAVQCWWASRRWRREPSQWWSKRWSQ